MNNKRGQILVLMVSLILIFLCNKGYAEESTFEIRHKYKSKGHKESVTGFLDKQEQRYLGEFLKPPKKLGKTKNKNSNKNKTVKPVGSKEKRLNTLLRIEDMRAQINGSVHNNQMRGMRKLMYIVIFTDGGTATDSAFNKLRYQTILFTSENVLKLSKIYADKYVETRMSEKTEFINYIYNPNQADGSAGGQRL